MSSENTRDFIAALDLGSNSFHLIVARRNDAGYRVIDKHKETVRLASGFDEQGNLKQEAIGKAVKALERLGERVRKIPNSNLRIVGTNTLRKAKNADVLIEAAERVLGHSIDVIAGAEEARLIFSGVTRGLNLEDRKYLVIDIGGGSTEIIAGYCEKPELLNSLHMGCISVTLNHFSKDILSRESFEVAHMSVAQELEPILRSYKEYGWDEVIGSSGTVLAIRDMLVKNNWNREGITIKGLNCLTEYLIEKGSTEALNLKGLSNNRKGILPGGLAILNGFFKGMAIERLSVSDNALREGVLNDLVGRIKNQDYRDITVKKLVELYELDVSQCERVNDSAFYIFNCIKDSWGLSKIEHLCFLNWAACLSEIGLAISFSQFHKHGAYLVQNLDMPGFSEKEKKILSLLVRAQRRKFPIREFLHLNLSEREKLVKISVILRLALLLHRSRSDFPFQHCSFEASDNSLNIRFPVDWLKNHSLTLADLRAEKEYLRVIDVDLCFNC